MKFSSRIFLWAPFVFLLAITIAVSVQWWSVAGRLSEKLGALNGREVMPGVTLHFASKTVGGFPFNVDAVLKDLTVTVKGPHGPLSWRTQNFAGHALTYGRAQWIFEAAGKQHLGWTTKDGKPKGLPFEAAATHASAVFTGDALARFDLDMIGFDSAALSAARTQFHLRRNGDAIDVVSSIELLRLSPPLRGACGETVDRIRYEGNLSNADALAKILEGAASWQASVDGWHAAGGRFFMAQGEIACGKFGAFVQGQIGIDKDKRPRGLLTAQIRNFERLRQAAQRNHAIGTFITNLLAQPAEPNPAQEGQVTVRVAFRDGLTYLGNTPTGLNDPLY